MAENTEISWTTHTFNPWRGCVKVSPACANCYAERQAKRNPSVLGEWGKAANRVVASEGYWRKPLLWDQAAAKAGARHRVFCASMADIFEQERKDLLQPRIRLLALVALTPSLDWLLLTKRPKLMADTLSSPNLYRAVLGEADGYWRKRFPRLGRVPISDPAMGWANLWAGTTVEDQARADERIPHLLRTPAAVRFLSCEPLLGPVVLPAGLDWVIAGGESGPKARPMHLQWARRLRDQCSERGVAFHFKQWGAWAPRGLGHGHVEGAPRVRLTICGCNSSSDTPIHGVPGSHTRHECDVGHDLWMQRVGKKAAGREIDGRVWDGLPTPAGASPSFSASESLRAVEAAGQAPLFGSPA